MANNQTRIKFNDGSGDYILPVVFHLSDPKEAMKATVIRGTRGDGSLVIPGGKRSQEITIRGKLFADDYVALTSLMNTMRTNITTDVATLTLEHNIGAGWVTDWARTVRRIEEIRFPQSFRTSSQEYEIVFLQISF